MRLLVVHSSAELYGSDRSLLDFLRLEGRRFDVTVLLPEDGPLVAHLQRAGARVEIGEVCKVQRQMLNAKGLLRTIAKAAVSVRALRQLAGGRPFDVVYSNSLAVFAGALYALVARRPHVWHVREILAALPRLASAYRLAVAWLATRIICNSTQTLNWIATKSSRSRCTLVWNGVPAKDASGVRELERSRHGWQSDALVFALVGRINGRKGQAVAIEAFERLQQSSVQPAILWLVGSAFAGQEQHERDLMARIQRSSLSSRIVLERFREDVDTVWQAADIVLVPSTEPESFGRVAVEAMAFGKPVIAAAHGGVLDIVSDEQSGLLVAPGDAVALANAMDRVLAQPQLRAELATGAIRRQRELFSVEAYAAGVSQVLVEAATSHR